MAPRVRTDEQILPRIRWVPIGKSNCYLNEEKSQPSPIFKIAVDILKQQYRLSIFNNFGILFVLTVKPGVISVNWTSNSLISLKTHSEMLFRLRQSIETGSIHMLSAITENVI
ncbi:hypothetical protein Tco_0195953 [Tanacetum coccineum]